MLIALLHRIVAHSWVYDLVQRALGAEQFREAVASRIPELSLPGQVVVDLGGGTGLYRGLWSSEGRYACLDVDPEKLRQFRRNHPRDGALLGDAGRIPLADRSVDLVFCCAVTHHIAPAELPALLAEVSRVLRKTGRFVLVDAVWQPRRLRGRLLWRFDRGSFPRTPAQLHEAVSAHMEILRWESMTIHHEYAFCVATPARRQGSIPSPNNC